MCSWEQEEELVNKTGCVMASCLSFHLIEQMTAYFRLLGMFVIHKDSWTFSYTFFLTC